MPYQYPPAVVQQLVSNGVPAVAGYVEAYFANTSVHASLFDVDGTELPWPVVADSNGQVSYCLNVSTTYDLRAYDALGSLLWAAPGVNAAPAGTITASYEVLTDALDPMPGYLGLKITEGANITITPVTGGPTGTVLQIAAVGGSTQWEVVDIGGTDYLTPVAGLPQLLSISEIRPAIGPLNLFAPTGQYIKSEVGGLVSDTMGRVVNAGTQIVSTVAAFDVLGVATAYSTINVQSNIISLLHSVGNKSLTIDADGVHVSTTAGVEPGAVLSIDPITGAIIQGALSPSDVGAQPASTNLGSIAGLADSAGWLKNNGAGTFSYSTPTASDVGAIPTGGAVLSVTASGTSITVDGTATNPTVALNLANENAWTTRQTITGSNAGYALQLTGYTNYQVLGVYSNYAGAVDQLQLINQSTNSSASSYWSQWLNYGSGIIRSFIMETTKASAAARMTIKLKNTGDSDAQPRLNFDPTLLAPEANNVFALGSSTRRWSNVYSTLLNVAGASTLTGDVSFAGAAMTWSGNPTHSGNHTFSGDITGNGNWIVGNASSDTLTVNATPTFNAPVKVTNTAFPTLTVERVADGTSGVRTSAYMTRKSSSAFAAVSNAFGCGQVYGANLAGTDYYFGYIAGRKLGTTGEITLVVYDDSASVSVTSNVGIFSKTEATLPQLAGTGTRMVTASSTGLLASRLASSYITQTLTASAAIAIDTELLRMTGTGFTGTLTTSLGDSRVISFRNSGTGNLTVACNGAETIDGVANLVIPVGGIAKICSVAAGLWETVL
jgi:hypothetical protein